MPIAPPRLSSECPRPGRAPVTPLTPTDVCRTKAAPSACSVPGAEPGPIPRARPPPAPEAGRGPGAGRGEQPRGPPAAGRPLASRPHARSSPWQNFCTRTRALPHAPPGASQAALSSGGRPTEIAPRAADTALGKGSPGGDSGSRVQAPRLPTASCGTDAGRHRSGWSRGRPSASARPGPGAPRPPPGLRPDRAAAPRPSRALPGRSSGPGACPRPSPGRCGSLGGCRPVYSSGDVAARGAGRGDRLGPSGNSLGALPPFRKTHRPLLLANSRPRAGLPRPQGRTREPTHNWREADFRK